MIYRGVVENGVVKLTNGSLLPDGTEVTVVPTAAQELSEDDGDQRSIGQKLADLARSVESMPCDLPEDLAINHDHYLHGLPKRKPRDRPSQTLTRISRCSIPKTLGTKSPRQKSQKSTGGS